jgi:hypothetical protein
MKNPIKSMEDLKVERRRLIAEIAEKELLLKADVAAAREMLKPINLVSHTAAKFVTSEDHTVLNKWVNTVVTSVLRNLVLARSGWIVKTIVPILVRNYANHKLEENKVDIVETLRGWLHKLRDKTNKHATNGYYDRSTADTNVNI